MKRSNLARQMARFAIDPDNLRAATVYIAAADARRGDIAKALDVYSGVLRDASRPGPLAAAAVCKGQSHLAREEWVPALLAFLQVPVFYPQQEALMPDVLLGCARAYIGLEDFTRARTALSRI